MMTAALSGTTAVALILSSAGAQIAIPDAATQVETTAAHELASALVRVTGVDYEVRSESAATDAEYCVGETKAARRLAAVNGWIECAADEIRRGMVDGKVVLSGDATRGVLYSVDSFLEDVVGVRWWNSGESDYPKMPNWRPDAVAAYRYAPPFRFRETFYRSTLTDPNFKVRAKVNATSYTRYIIPPTVERMIPAEKGGNHKLVFFKGRRSAYHSFFEVLPPEKYAKNHPDWYSEVDGRRIGRGQLCVTNPEMLAEYVKNTLALLRANPDCDAISVSQNDGETGATVCHCARCLSEKASEGSWSGPYLKFANAVAAAIEPEFPRVNVDTFAYTFTRKAPKTVRPRRNVLVRLCDGECAFNRPIADSTYEANVVFRRDLEEWSRVAEGNLYIWDYQANFESYIMPHPNLHVFAENLRLFRDAGAVGVFEQGDAMCPAGDFCALKCYVTSHLMWDPSRDWRKLTDEFLRGYYGASAAPHLKRALEIATASASREGVWRMSPTHREPFPWITPEAGKAAVAAMDAALAAAKKDGPEFVRRVRLAKLSWDHARIRAWGEWGLEGEPSAVARDFRLALAEFGIVAYRETTTRQTLVDYLNGPLRVAERGVDWVKLFSVNGRDVAVDARNQLDFTKVYPGEIRKGEVGERYAEAKAVVDGGKGGKRTLLVYQDWFGELSVNGGKVMKLDGPCDNEELRHVELALKPGRNEIRMRVRAGSDGRWYLALGLLR